MHFKEMRSKKSDCFKVFELLKSFFFSLCLSNQMKQEAFDM